MRIDLKPLEFAEGSSVISRTVALVGCMGQKAVCRGSRESQDNECVQGRVEI